VAPGDVAERYLTAVGETFTEDKRIRLKNWSCGCITQDIYDNGVCRVNEACAKHERPLVTGAEEDA
jgi:hypothetical protein